MILYNSRFVGKIFGKMGWRYGCSDMESGDHRWMKKPGSKTYDVYDVPQPHSLHYSSGSHFKYSHFLAKQTHVLLLFCLSTIYAHITSLAGHGTDP